MKKGLVLAAILTAGAVLAGCSRSGAGDGLLTQNCLLVDGSGGVSWMSVESYEGGQYSEEEMVGSAKEVLDRYNASIGVPGAVSFVSGELKDGSASLVTAYDTPARLLDFAAEIGDYNMPFTLLETGTAAALGTELSGSGIALENTSGKTVETAKALSDADSLVVKAEGSGLVRGENKIQYVSSGCSLRDAYTAQTAEEGISYIIFAK